MVKNIDSRDRRFAHFTGHMVKGTSLRVEPKEGRYVILMTATIDPGTYAGKLLRHDPQKRLADYEWSLGRMLTLEDHRIAGIVFCENSGSSLTSLRHIAAGSSKPVEFLSFEGNFQPDNMAYGYSELGTIDHAVLNSTLIRDNTYFIKTTGRLSFPKIPSLLDSLPGHVDAMFDYVANRGSDRRFKYRSRCQLILFSRAYYLKRFLGRRDQMFGVSDILEEFIPYLVEQHSEDAVLRRFPIECPPRGVAGYNNRSYSDVRELGKQLLRATTRRMLPALWI